MVPSSFGCGLVVLAAIATLAPSAAARRPIASPMPREAPVMNSVLPLSDIVGWLSDSGFLHDAAAYASVRPRGSGEPGGQELDSRVRGNDRKDRRSTLQLTGIHHLTAVSADAPGNKKFYTQTLGLRLVKKTVNQDDVSAYHLFYADGLASPGSDITFFDFPTV